jgi:hypothetical protein
MASDRPKGADSMKTFTVTVKYTVATTYTIEAEHEEAAEAEAWREVNSDPDHAMSYGNWELLNIQEETTA